MSVTSDQLKEAPKMGRSLWDDARDRLLANKAAVTSLIVLAVITLLSVVGPMLTPHPYDQVYRDYVKQPASLEAYPKQDEIQPAFAKIAKRARMTVDSYELNDGKVTATVTSRRKLDERYARYFDRSDLFESAAISNISSDKKSATVTADIQYMHFYFGTDANGRDMLTRTLIAGRVSLTIGLLATFVAISIGVFWGAASGYFGGRVDLVMMRVVDILYSLPFIFFVIMLVVFFGRNFVLMFIAVGAVEWLDMARIVRGQTLSIKRQEYVQAAEAMGVEGGGILKRHIIPNTLGPVVIYMTLLVPKVILLESFLSFLGLGVQEPMTSWGVLISEGARNLQGAAWMLVFPAIFLTSTLFALNFIGDGLRDALDPKDR
ncbi:Oligopeptide transport system permease protein OppC [Pseudovibrio sp. Ad13]|uniref:ABC transporter permease subunit n=1 Tax=unclassified Pseudovibrio TaxID=2627060 RepID=UPI000709DD7C|nr:MULTISPECIES: ABC transporter permease subunit [unclassified Pseudovibrio]KZK84106.1 Oligopeptide transport system permease protein OppC [Pseudovibrio sp. Ad13]KZK86315.1 Oligopeptide transport system permease protein OppC [Pseudovibrio sp. Ad46]KZK92207.1 Oligopeptide transport system permease protein OppC [Pseudovibrio sp. Ad5]KZK96954.1 Oligopeptide transport system permease protein OppC [Pseudovibrio sp. W74]KZL08673.1 Oligopeptide transport system permease protein OppC [Pseudovibrio sp